MTQQYTSWTFEEETLLLARSTSGIPIAIIAVIHCRTTNAIRCRLERIASKHLEKGRSNEQVARLTGLSIKDLQKLQNGKGKTSITFKHTMRALQTLSRAELQAIPAQRRLEAIQRYIDQFIYQHVYAASAAGKTSYLYVLPKTSQNMGSSYPPTYEVTPSDIIEGLNAKFPDCTVSFSDEWVDVRPGVREQRSGILIDWS